MDSINLNIDTGIFIAFLLLNLLVGLTYGKGVKTMNDYALGGRNFSTGALVATLVATAASGSGFFIALSKTYSDGLYYVIPSLFIGFELYIVGVLFVPRMGEFLGKNSVAEAMGNLYGSGIRTITAISGTIGAVGYIAVQFKAFGTIFSYFLGFPEVFSIVLAGSIVTIYSAFGGVRSVTFTDVLQFITFGVTIPLVGVLIWSQLYSENFSIIDAFEHPKFDYKVVLNIGNPGFWEMITLALYFTVPSMIPAFCQRIFMGGSVTQVRKAFIIAGILFVIIRLSVEWIPFLIFNVNPELKSNELLSYIVDHYTFTGLKGLMIITITALAMSTADSYINSSSVLFANDLCKPLNLSPDNTLLISRIFSCVLGVGGIYLAFHAKDLLDMVMSAQSFYGPVVAVPFMMAIFGFRSSTKSVLIAMAAGLITVRIWKYLGIKADGIVFAMFINMIFLLGSHYILKQPGGWVGIKDRRYLDELRIAKLQSRQKFIKSIYEFSIIKFLKEQTPRYELTYTGFGIYCVIYTLTTMYSTQHTLLGEHNRLILTMYQIMLVTGVIIALYPIWPTRLKKEILIQSWWNIAIFYMLSLFSVFFILLGKFTTLQCMVFTMNTVVAIILAGWRMGAAIIVIGFYFGFQMYKFYAGDISITENFAPQAVMLYSLLLLSSVVMIFLKPKQEYIETTEHKVGELGVEVKTLQTQTKVLERDVFNFAHENYNLSNRVRKMDYELEERTIRAQHQEYEIKRLGAAAEKLLNNVNHELRLPIGNVVNFAAMLRDAVEKYDQKQLKELTDEVYKNSTRLSSMILNMLDLATLNVQKVDLDKTLVNLTEIVIDRVSTCCRVYLEDKPINFDLSVQEEIMVSVDPNYMRQTVDNLVINAIKFSEKGLVKIDLSEKNGQIRFIITDQGKGIPKGELTDIFQAFKIGSNSESKSSGRGVGLALCKAVIEAHGGEIKAESDGKNWAMFTFFLPLET